jgi:hypothetical protein
MNTFRSNVFVNVEVEEINKRLPLYKFTNRKKGKNYTISAYCGAKIWWDKFEIFNEERNNDYGIVNLRQLISIHESLSRKN